MRSYVGNQKGGDFVFQQSLTKRSEIYYIGKVISNKTDDDMEFGVSYLRMSHRCQKFNILKFNEEMKKVVLVVEITSRMITVAHHYDCLLYTSRCV